MIEPVQSVRDLHLSPASALREAIEVIDRGAVQVCLVVDDSHRLLGILSDGDVRRALLGGCSMETPVAEVMNADFRFLSVPADTRKAKELMARLQIRHLPVLNPSGQVEEFFTLSTGSENPLRSLPVVVMAGGQGMRLRPLTEATPKPMLVVGNKPILERILDRCGSAGLRDIYLSVNYLAAQIQDHFEDGSRWGLTIKYLEEVEPLGTAGPLGLLPPNISGPFVVLNGDVLTEVDLRRMVESHDDRGPAATVALREFVVGVPYGVVSLEGVDVREIREKPSFRHFVNAGVYVLTREVVDLILPGHACDMPDLLRNAIEKGLSVKGFPIHEDWLDVGSFESLGEAREKHG